MQDDLFTIKLLVHHHVHVVLFLFNVNRHVNALSFDCNRNRSSVVLILEKKSEILINLIYFVGRERKLNLDARVTFYLNATLELNLG